MRNLRDHAANGRGIRALNHLIQPREPESFDHAFVRDRRTYFRAHILQAQRASTLSFFLYHHYNSSAVLPRTPATNSLFLSFFSASNVALITLCGFVVP